MAESVTSKMRQLLRGDDAPAPDHAAGHAHGVGHVVPVWILAAVFGALMILTVLTVGATLVDLGSAGNVLIALGIAVVKAALVMLFFMHLRWDSPFNSVICITSLLFVALFIAISVIDTSQSLPTLEPPAATVARPGR